MQRNNELRGLYEIRIPLMQEDEVQEFLSYPAARMEYRSLLWRWRGVTFRRMFRKRRKPAM